MKRALGIQLLALVAAMMLAGACNSAPPKSEAELRLSPAQAAGRQVFERHCAECHEAYSSRPLRGPSLQGLLQKPYMPSGTPANDDRVREVILMGRANMPGYGRLLTPQEVDELMAFLHTL